MKTKSLPWFRFYTEVPDDPKIHRLSDALHRFWVNCLCLAGRHQGVLPEVGDIAYHVRKPDAKVLVMRGELVDYGLIDEVSPGKFIPHNWASRQYEADVSTSRVKRFRDKKKTVSETVDETVSETDETVDETVGNGFMKRFPSVSVSVSASDSESVSEKKEVVRQIREPPRDLFGIFWKLFIAAGKALNDRDKEKTLRLWLNYDPQVHEQIIRWTVEMMKTKWSDEQHTPMPHNALLTEGWTRQSTPRIIPTPEPPSKNDEALRIYEERQARKQQRDHV